ncbi:GNAT family N-acetyltransferase [Agromyces endophyticus]|uniref:GNAT family N-acetyltransferase n=1 Tax=Agromyces sp. H17E-10 TaxID=2932244 RepID=UPI001FD1EC36|nr:GNAT family N-acetyltransferase [Agromyces sp. H17E-10]UOQ88492.1 GNAT family N-acetyltransferase [Agromyces sp. H17E-10]
MPRDLDFSTDPARLDRERVHRWLSEHAYWALGRPRETQDAAIDGSMNFGVYDRGSGEQLAYARVVTDGVTFAWLCDVIVDPDTRGERLGVSLMEYVLATLDPMRLKRVVLITGDAHGLYEKFGFAPIDRAADWMSRVGPNPVV